MTYGELERVIKKLKALAKKAKVHADDSSGETQAYWDGFLDGMETAVSYLEQKL